MASVVVMEYRMYLEDIDEFGKGGIREGGVQNSYKVSDAMGMEVDLQLNTVLPLGSLDHEPL